MTEEQMREAAAKKARWSLAFDTGMLFGIALMVYGAFLISKPVGLMVAGFFLGAVCYALEGANARSRNE